MTISHAGNSPLNIAPGIKIAVWYSSNAALKEGQAVCYNWDLGTPTDPIARRFNEVETPTTLNAQYFAGVSAGEYAALASGQLIEIYVPGSVCNILVGVNTVKGEGFLTFDVTAAYVGQFRYTGLPGEGSAVPAQTTTFNTNPHKVLAKLQTGPASGGVEVVDIVDNDVIGTLMIGGTTLVVGAAIGGGNCTYILADGAAPGLRKKFNIIDTAITSSDLIVTVSNGATDDIDDAVLATITWANGGTTLAQEVSLIWDAAWLVIGRTKTYPALA